MDSREPKAAVLAARPSIVSQRPGPFEGQNRPGAEWVWRTLFVRHPNHFATDLKIPVQVTPLRDV
jgi:hypothetical protein